MTTLTAMPKYEAYKDSGVEWLGEVPVDWELVALNRTVVNCVNGLWGNEPNNLNDIVVLRVADFDRNKLKIDDGKLTLRSIPVKDRNGRVLKKGDLLIEKSGGGDKTLVGCVVLFDKDYEAVTSNFVAKMTPKNNFESRFLCYVFSFLYSSDINYRSIKQTTGIQNLDSSAYLLEVAAFPSLKVQTAIANFLDEKTAKIDEAIAIKQKQIELLKERKQIIIQQAVTQGLDSTVPMKDSGVEWIGQIPAHWEVRKFKFLANVRYGLGQPPKQLEDGLKIIRATNVERGKIVENGMMFVDPNDIPWDRNPTLKHGEIIVVRSGAYTGDSALVTEDYDGCIAGYDMVATPKTCRPRFLAYALLSHYVLYEQIYLMRMRSAQPHLNAEELNEVLIVLPPDCEQINISRYIDKVDKEVCSSLQIIRSQIEKLKEYKTTLINSAVTGKIKVV